MSDIRNFEAFLRDADHFIFSLFRIVGSFKKQYTLQKVNEGFRYAHSLKSEASYLGFDQLKAAAEEIENLFSLMRDSAVAPNQSLQIRLDEMLAEARMVYKAINKDVEIPRSEKPDTTIEREALGEMPTLYEEEPEEDGSSLVFSDFELKLIEEAALRRETFYRLICRIDAEPDMLYARAFLLVSNLEQRVNLIRTQPAFSEEVDLSEMVLFFTASLSEKQILKAVNIDQVDRSELMRLDYKMFLGEYQPEKLVIGNESDPPRTGLDNYVSIRVDELDEIVGYIGDLRVLSLRMRNRLPSKDGQLIAKIIDGIEDRMRSIRTVTLQEMAERFPFYVHELALRMDKKVEFVTDYDPALTMDRYTLDVLSDSVMHLIRNAMDHGIESAAEREERGKPASGTIRFSCHPNSDGLCIVLEDDGGGIDHPEVDVEARKRDLDPEKDLLSILSLPGFSTAERIGDYSGRGVGLDLVVHNIKQLLGGDIRVDNHPGKGLSVSMMLPAEDSSLALTVFQYGIHTCAIPTRNIQRSGVFNPGAIVRGEEGLLYRDGKDTESLYTISGRISQCGSFSEKGDVMLINHMNHRVFLLVDELLVERHIKMKSFSLGDEVEPFIYTLLINKRKADYLYVTPAFIL